MTGTTRSAPHTHGQATHDRINVGGRSLAMTCSGSGSPTVVLESGLGAESA